MKSIARAFDDPIGSPSHVAFRDRLWIAGYFFEARYFLGIATGANEFLKADDEYKKDYREHVLSKWPGSHMFLKSSYWEQYFLVLLRQAYRESVNGELYPIRAESKPEKALRILVANPSITHPQLAKVLKTTEKQLLRMTMVQLAFRELSWNFVYPEQLTKPRKR